MKKEQKHHEEQKKEETQQETKEEIKVEECKIDPKDQAIIDLTETLQHVQAEFENYRKRTQKESLEFKKYANEELIKKILQPLDYFELSLKHTENKEAFIKGVEMIHAQLLSVLESEGLKRIDVLNKEFNPATSEAVMVEEKQGQKPHKVFEEVQKGYMLNDRVIRHAKVKITK